MNSLDTGKDKIKKICEIIKTETLEPVKEESARIIAAAEERALLLTREAEGRAEEMLKKARAKIQKERESFESSLKQAIIKGIEELKQDIEEKLFHKEIVDWVVAQTVDLDLGARWVTALVEAVEREGTSADFSAATAKTLPPAKINALLGKKILERLREKGVIVGDFMGGVRLYLRDKNITLDVSDEALVELLKTYLHKDFRDILFP